MIGNEKKKLDKGWAGMVYARSMDNLICLDSYQPTTDPLLSQHVIAGTMTTHDDKHPISTTHGDSMETGDDTLAKVLQ